MVSILELLPLLEGWEQVPLDWTGTIYKRKSRPIERKDRRGWLLGIDVLSDDAYGSVRVEYSGRMSAWIFPYFLNLYNLVYPPPAGAYYSLYNNTGPGTYGLYAFTIFTSAYPYPFRGYVAAEVSLGAASTQTSATLSLFITILEIIDPPVFKESLRKLYEELGITKKE